LKRATFSTPGGSGQIRLISVKKIEMSDLSFTALVDSNAVQGGSIYCRDCFQISISTSKFQGQVTTLAGGAIYLEQTSAPKYANSRTAANVFQDLEFSGCQALVGAAIYTKQPNYLTILNSSFDKNVVYTMNTQAYRDMIIE
jgi:hypothetical protein